MACFNVDPDCGVCGDGNTNAGEECDDGNTVNRDGCDEECVIECDIQTPCPEGTTECSDGTCSINCATCDAGQSYCDYDDVCDFGEGCTCSDCLYEDANCGPGLQCSLEDEACCDFHSDNYCNQYCLEVDPDCQEEPPIPPNCGDGNVNPGEECDDGNNLNRDGCSESCQTEGDDDDPIPPLCQDGNLDLGEECDDGNSQNRDGCNAICEIECGVSTPCPARTSQCGDGTCSMDCGLCFIGCGDGNLDFGEECDDGNNLNRDGCNNECQIEGDDDDPIPPLCQDGNLDFGEECDDGNSVNRDGCNAICEIECSIPTPCPEGTYLCDDNTCSMNCLLCYVEPSECDEDGICDSNEGCACEDCHDEQDSCENNLLCSLDGSTCCNPDADNFCDYACAYIDPDCSFSCISNNDCDDGYCDNGACISNNCDNNIMDGLEDGIDCGGMCSEECPYCGNGVQELLEQCDFGDDNGRGLGCDRHCQYECDIRPPCPVGTTLCGDGTCSINCYQCGVGVAICDGYPDGVCSDGEGCSCPDCDGERDSCSRGLTCALSIPPFGSCCDQTGDGTCNEACFAVDPDCGVCGDGNVNSGEECDDGNTENRDGCSERCTIECNLETDCPEGTSLCGDGTCSLDCAFCRTGQTLCDYNGVCDSNEGCSCSDCDGQIDSCDEGLACSLEDGACCNTQRNDICSFYCIESDPDCREPELLNPTCGDGNIDFGEQCDFGDNNGVSSGCSAECNILCGLGQPCPEGTYLCEDGTCSINCVWCEVNPSGCNENGICDSNEGCACEDCDDEQDSCEEELLCSLDSGTCCSSEEDNWCDFACAYIDPDCMYTCELDSDCDSGWCDEDICRDTSCDDGRMNNGETDVDCGGPCSDCEDATMCEEDSDCISNKCEAGACAPNGPIEDTDNDGIPDYWEEAYNMDPEDPTDAEEDADQDGYTNLEEFEVGTDPLDEMENPDIDTDEDGIPDYWEEQFELDPENPADANEDADQDGYTNLEEFEAGTDPQDKYSIPPSEIGVGPVVIEQEKSILIPLIFIIVGLLLIAAGTTYLIIDKKKQTEQKKKQAQMVRLIDTKQRTPQIQPQVKKRVAPVKPKVNPADEIFKKRVEKKKEKRRSAVGVFGTEEEEKQEEEPKKKHSIFDDEEEEVKTVSIKKKADTKLDEGKKIDEDGFVDLSASDKEEDISQKDVGKDVFQELELINKGEKPKEDDKTDVELEKKKEATSTSSDTNKKAEKFPLDLGGGSKTGGKKKQVGKKAKLEAKDDIFKQLAGMSGQTHEEVKKHVDKEKVTSQDLMKVFANVTSKKQIDANVFKAILSQLLGKSHVSKQTVAEILFEFLDQEMLSKKEVSDLLRDLKLTAKK